MKDGKAEVLNLTIEEGMIMRVTLAGREDRDIFANVVRMTAAPGTTFEFIGETELLCKPPKQRR